MNPVLWSVVGAVAVIVAIELYRAHCRQPLIGLVALYREHRRLPREQQPRELQSDWLRSFLPAGEVDHVHSGSISTPQERNHA